MAETQKNPRDEPVEPLLRKADQITLVVLATGCLVSLAVFWYLQGLHRGQRIDIDHAPPQQYSFELDLNSAPWTELALLPSIGEVLAKRIVRYRDEHGPFRRLEQLENVNGIGPKTRRKIEGFLRVRNPANKAADQQSSQVPAAAREH